MVQQTNDGTPWYNAWDYRFSPGNCYYEEQKRQEEQRKRQEEESRQAEQRRQEEQRKQEEIHKSQQFTSSASSNYSTAGTYTSSTNRQTVNNTYQSSQNTYYQSPYATNYASATTKNSSFSSRNATKGKAHILYIIFVLLPSLFLIPMSSIQQFINKTIDFVKIEQITDYLQNNKSQDSISAKQIKPQKTTRRVIPKKKRSNHKNFRKNASQQRRHSREVNYRRTSQLE